MDTLFLDNFDGTNGSALSSHTSDSGHSWSGDASVMTLTGTGAVQTTGTTGRTATASANCPDVSAVSIEFSCTHKGTSGNARWVSGLLVDPSTGASLGAVFKRLSGTTDIWLYNGGGAIGAYSGTLAFDVEHTIKTVLSGGTVEVFLDGTSVHSESSSVNPLNWNPQTKIQSGSTGDTVLSKLLLEYTAATVVLGTGAADCPLKIGVFRTGRAECIADINVLFDRAVCPISLSLTYPTGRSECRADFRVSSTGQTDARLSILLDAGTRDGWWSAKVMLGGSDVSGRLTGLIKVDAEEGAARIAEFSIKPASGTIDPMAQLGAAVTIDYLLNAHGAVVQSSRLFTGRVDTPSINLANGVQHFVCTDDLRQRVAAMSIDQVDALTGGYYSPAIQGYYDVSIQYVPIPPAALPPPTLQSPTAPPPYQNTLHDRWDYAMARMSTVAASLDCDAYGTPRVTPWQDAPLAGTFADGDLEDGSLAVDLPSRSGIVNVIRVIYEYRYTRLRQRWAGLGWSMVYPDTANSGFQYPDQATIAGAFSGVGWQVIWQAFWPAPVKIAYEDGFVYPPEGSISMAQAQITQRHSQTLTEHHTLMVRAPESITLNGEIAQEIRGALESNYSGQAWETDFSLAPFLTPAASQTDYAPDATTTQSADAMKVLLEQAKVKILASHRSGRARAACPCAPKIDLNSRVELATTALAVTGKVASVIHSLDIQAGSALTDFALALYAANGTGTVTPTPLDPETLSPDIALMEDSIPPLQTVVGGDNVGDEGWMGWLVNPAKSITIQDSPDGTKTVANPSYVPPASGLSVTGYRVNGPGVNAANRNPVIVEAVANYDIAMPLDGMLITL